MKNENNEQIVNDNNVVSDEALSNVSGGTQWVEFGGFGTTYQSGVGVKVKVVDGSKCPTCGGTIGFLDFNPTGGLCVKCSECKSVILDPHRFEAVEIL